MADEKKLATETTQDQIEETRTGPVLFSKVGVSPVEIVGFDPVGKPVQELLEHLGSTEGLEWEGYQILITRDGQGGRVGLDAIVRPGDLIQMMENLANN